jgi:Ca2+-binding EF-hand superfamily protein
MWQLLPPEDGMASKMLTVGFAILATAGTATAQRVGTRAPQTTNDWTEQGFRDLDRNGDGRITTDEWSFDREAFRRADHNGDGVVTRREFLGGDDAGAYDSDDDGVAARRFDRLDSNRDNRISRGEWTESRAAFERLDENNDGQLTRAELGAEPESVGQAVGRFRDVDADGNGSITRGEWTGSAASFTRLDTNRDGRLSRAEFAAYRREIGNGNGNGNGYGVGNGNGGGIGAGGSGGDVYRSPAWRAGYDRGLAEGRNAGREDKERRNQWDLDGQRELEQADSGYDRSIGSREDYQAGYRAAFRVGYREGFGPRQ